MLVHARTTLICVVLTGLVTGCSNVEPPEGAWMTRDGDVIEIGCHSGSKTWTLTCDANKWIGVIGYCGHMNVDKFPKESDDVIIDKQHSVWNVSPSKGMMLRWRNHSPFGNRIFFCTF